MSVTHKEHPTQSHATAWRVVFIQEVANERELTFQNIYQAKLSEPQINSNRNDER